MMHWQIEGEEVKHGLSVYHPKNLNSAGALLRLGNHVLRLRWSKNAKRFFGGYYKIDPLALEKLKTWEILNGHKQ